MRIIGGNLRGRKIRQPLLKSVRPTKDRVREAVFNMIAEKVPSSMVLDLFAGSGAYGLEALSRGAAGSIFVENDKDCASVLMKNIDSLSLSDKSEVIIKDAEVFFAENTQKFDLIFSDPPYGYNITRNNLIMINQYDILNPSGILVCEHSSSEDVSLEEEVCLSVYKQKSYGDTTISIFQKR